MRIIYILIITVFFANIQIFPEKKLFTLDNDEFKNLYNKVDRDWINKYSLDNLKTGSGSPELASFILNASFVKYPAERIEKALNHLKNFQNKNISTKNYLNFYWYWGDKEVNDTNGVEFVNRQIIIAWMLYKDNLNKKSIEILQEILKLANQGVKKHNVKLSYTNIILMKTWNLISFGESFNDRSSADEGYKIFNDWINYTGQFGITEFLSPTYYAVDLENLGLIYNFTNNSEIKEKAKIMLDYFWTDISANWYGPQKRLGGTHSRDYDRLFGHGQLDSFAARAGFSSEGDEYKKNITPFDYYSFYQPPEILKKYTLTFPRFITERLGEAKNKYAFNYTGKNFTVATALSNYFNMDKTPFVVSLGSEAETPVINFFMDGRSDYYGYDKILERSGHMKSLHLIPFLTSIQNESEVLFLASIKENSKDFKKLESIITLPAKAEYYLNDKKLEIFNYKSSWVYSPLPNNKATNITLEENNKNTIVHLVDNDETAGLGISQIINVMPGNVYKFKVSFKGNNINLYMNWYNGKNELIGNENIKRLTGKMSSFTEGEQEEKAPAGASFCKAWIYSTIKDKSDIYLNDISFYKANDPSKPLAFFDFKKEKKESYEIALGSNLFIRKEDTVCVIKPVLCYDDEFKSVPMTLYNDGLEHNAFRLTVLHSSKESNRRGAIAVWSYTEEGITDEKKFEEFRKKISRVKSSFSKKESVLNIEINGIKNEMKIVCDLDKDEVISQTGNKYEYQNMLLTINGYDAGKELLKNINSKKIN